MAMIQMTPIISGILFGLLLTDTMSLLVGLIGYRKAMSLLRQSYHDDFPFKKLTPAFTMKNGVLFFSNGHTYGACTGIHFGVLSILLSKKVHREAQKRKIITWHKNVRIS